MGTPKLTHTFNVENVKATAWAAFKAGTLTAQHSNPAERSCRYDIYTTNGIPCRCAIGAGLPDPVIKRILDKGWNTNYVTDACFSDIFLFNSDEEKEEIRLIQQAHDNWCFASNPYSDEAEQAKMRIYKQKFINLVKPEGETV